MTLDDIRRTIETGAFYDLPAADFQAALLSLLSTAESALRTADAQRRTIEAQASTIATLEGAVDAQARLLEEQRSAVAKGIEALEIYHPADRPN